MFCNSNRAVHNKAYNTYKPRTNNNKNRPSNKYMKKAKYSNNNNNNNKHNIYSNVKNMTLSTFAVTKDDTQLIPLFSDNFKDVTINESIKITAIVGTGAGVSVINTKKSEKLRARSQQCDVYECKNIKLNAISGTQLNVVGRVFLRVHMNKCLLRISAYVVSNMVNSFVIGNDILRKHRMIIDFNSINLLIKSENVHALDYVVVPPRKQVKVHMHGIQNSYYYLRRNRPSVFA